MSWRRRAAAGLAEIREELGSGSPRRRLVAGVLVAVLLWLGGNALHESLWSYRYWKVDPWALEAPVQWPVVGRHARALDDLSRELQSCLEPGASLAVEPPEAWNQQGFYLFMWLAYSFPEQHVIPIADPRDVDQADHLLRYYGDGPPPPDRPDRVVRCAGHRALIFDRVPAP